LRRGRNGNEGAGCGIPGDAHGPVAVDVAAGGRLRCLKRNGKRKEKTSRRSPQFFEKHTSTTSARQLLNASLPAAASAAASSSSSAAAAATTTNITFGSDEQKKLKQHSKQKACHTFLLFFPLPNFPSALFSSLPPSSSRSCSHPDLHRRLRSHSLKIKKKRTGRQLGGWSGTSERRASPFPSDSSLFFSPSLETFWQL